MMVELDGEIPLGDASVAHNETQDVEVTNSLGDVTDLPNESESQASFFGRDRLAAVNVAALRFRLWGVTSRTRRGCMSGDGGR